MQISPTGVPICPIGIEMKPNGYDSTQNRQNGVARWLVARRTRVPLLVQPLNTGGLTIHSKPITLVCFRRQVDCLKLGKRSTNAAPRSSAPTNGRRLITSWKQDAIVPRRCGTSGSTAY
jgi:hypothetical protein